MNDEMQDSIEACNQDPGIGAIIVTGAGRGFCAGADVQGFNNSIDAREAADGLVARWTAAATTSTSPPSCAARSR